MSPMVIEKSRYMQTANMNNNKTLTVSSAGHEDHWLINPYQSPQNVRVGVAHVWIGEEGGWHLIRCR